MSKYVSLAAAAAIAVAVSAGATGAQAAVMNPITNNFELIGQSSGNDCTGALGTSPNCVWDSSPQIVKFDFAADGSIENVEWGIFGDLGIDKFSILQGPEVGDFGFSWTYSPDADDPGITAFSVKGGPNWNVWQKATEAFLGHGDFSDNWHPPIHNNQISGLSHIVFYDTLVPIPLPAGLVLFLSGLAGIGFLGRYKAKRREPATT